MNGNSKVKERPSLEHPVLSEGSSNEARPDWRAVEPKYRREANMVDGISNASTADMNTESSKYSAPCRAGAGGKAIATRTISRPKIIGAISPPPYAQSSPPKPDVEGAQSPPAAHRDDSLAPNPSAGLVTEDHPPKRRRGGWGRAGVLAVVAWLAWPTAAFAQGIGVYSIASNDVVDASEKWAGFTITGGTGTESSVTVTVNVNGTQVGTATSDASGNWVVNVDGDASFVTTTVSGQYAEATRGTPGNLDFLSHQRSFTANLKLPLVVNAVTGDDTINIAEKASGFTISGDTGTESGVTVDVSIDTGTLSTTSGAAGAWSVVVPSNANYITETSVDLTVTATKTGSVSATVTRTLPVDLTAPTVSYNTTPSSLKVGVAISAMAPTTSDTDIASYGVHDDDSLPPGLAIDESTGVISGAPTTANNSTREVRVLATDDARNETTETITFPKVDMGDQTLVGFAYGAARIRYGDTAPRVTEPTGARTPVTYSAVPATVCTVNSLGALTIRAGGTCTITASANGDANYNAAADVTLGLEVARVTVDPPPESLPPEGLPVPEGGSAGYTVVLDTQPTHDVTINVNRRGSGGDTDLTASPVGLTFTDSNWNTPQTVTLSAAEDDDGARGIVNFGHNAVSADSIYGGIGAPAVKAVEDDNDPIGVTIWPQVLRMPDGGSRKYTVVLNTQPTDDVTITVTRDHGGDDDLTADPNTLIFTEATWYTPQTVTVSAAKDDDQVNGVAIFSHSVESNDENYQSDDEITIAPVRVTEDETRPRVAIQTEASSPVGGAFEVTIRFSESVEGFELEDIEVSNGTASNFNRVSSRTYTVTITPEETGEVRVEVGSNVARDGVGNRNRAAEPLVIEADLERPEVTIEGPTEPVGMAVFEVTITFSEPVTGFELEDIRVTNGTASNFTKVSPQEYTATITPSASGAVKMEVAEDVARDGGGNGNRAAEPLVIEADLERPEVTIAGPTEPVGMAGFEVTITFSEPVEGFELEDIRVTNGTASNFTKVSPQEYTATITPEGIGAVRVEVPKDVAEDGGGNGNRAAEPLVIETDLERPEVTIAGPTEPVGMAGFEVTITFSEPVEGFELEDIRVTNGTASNFTKVSPQEYTATITPEGIGAVRVEVPKDVAEDGAGNGNQAAEPLVIETDLERPEVTIAGPTEPVGMAGFEVRIAFSEPVEGFELEDIRVTNGTASNFTKVSPQEYTATITPEGIGAVRVEVPKDVAEDGAGNGNQAAEAFELETKLAVSYQEESYTAREGGETVTVTVKLSQGWDEELAIPIRVTRPETTEVADYTLDGLQEWDAQEGAGTLTFPAEETEQTFRIAANHDGDGDDETLKLGFGELPEIVLTGEPGVATVMLEDKGLVELKVSFGQAEYQIREGQQADIEVKVAPTADRRVEVPLVVSLKGGASEADYSGVPVSLVIEEGESEGTISVEVLADEVNDPGEGIVLSFGELPEAVSEGEIPQTTVNFRQRRTAEQFSQTLEVALAVMARSMGESVQTAIEGRFERHRQWSRLGAAGGAVSTAQPGSDNSATGLGEGESQRIDSESLEDAGRRRAEGPVVPSAGGGAGGRAVMGSSGELGDRESDVQGAWLQNVSLGGLAGLFGYGQGDAGVSTGSSMGPSGTGPTVGLGGQPGHGQNRFQGAGTRNSSLRSGSGEYSGRRNRELNLAGVSLELPLAGQQKGTSRSWVPALWGQGDLQHFNGNLARYEMSYRGGLEAAHVALDLYANDKVLTGLSFMRSWGNMDYSDDGIDGVLRSRMSTFHPYLYWQPTERVSVWGIGGLGRGRVDVNEPGRSHDFEADFRMFAGGLRTVLTRRGSNELGLRADAFSAQLRTEASEDIAKVRGEAHLARLMLEWVHTKQLSVGRSLSLKAEAGGRFDGGDAERGSGAETGFRLGYLDANSGLDVAMYGRVLMVHTSDYRDWGLGVQASWDPGEKQRGFRVSVTSTRGQDGGGRTTLWNNANMVTRPAGMGAMGLSSQYRMESEVAYGGLKAPGVPGLLTPYSRLRWAGQGRELAWGTAWSLPPRSQLAPPLMLETEAMRRESATGPADLAVLVRMSIPF